jgi:hypothetical protein
MPTERVERATRIRDVPSGPASPYCVGTEPAATSLWLVAAPRSMPPLNNLVTSLIQRVRRLLELGFLARHHASGREGLAALLS